MKEKLFGLSSDDLDLMALKYARNKKKVSETTIQAYKDGVADTMKNSFVDMLKYYQKRYSNLLAYRQECASYSGGYVKQDERDNIHQLNGLIDELIEVGSKIYETSKNKSY